MQGAADRYLVYFEDDLRVIRRLLETARGKEMLASRQVMLVHLGANDGDVDDVREPLKELKGSLERCQSLCDDIADAFSDLKQALVGEHVSRIQSVSEIIEGLQLKLGGEVAQVQILGPVNHIRSILFERKSSEIEGDDQQTEQQQMAAYCDSNREEILSLKEAARLNLQLLEADAW